MTIPLMCLNGKDITEYGLKPLEGTINTLMKPRPMKTLVTNENAFIHGSMVLSQKTARRYAKQDFSLLFYIQGGYSLTDLHRNIENLASTLIAGIDNTGVNELTIPEIETTYRLVYSSIDKYTDFSLSGNAIISIKFTEPNPNNRTLAL